MIKPKICAVLVSNDPKTAAEAEPMVDLFEVRIDLIGDGWQGLVKRLRKPWIACNRCLEEGGQWPDNEARRVEKLLEAIELGADIVDIELRTKNLGKIVPAIRKRTKCLLSCHDLKKTPPLDEMKDLVNRQIKAGADICKIVTTARRPEDNLAVLKLIPEFPGVRIISLAMGPLGAMSRVLCPLLGGDFTYASTGKGKESAEGQLTVPELAQIYEMVRG